MRDSIRDFDTEYLHCGYFWICTTSNKIKVDDLCDCNEGELPLYLGEDPYSGGCIASTFTHLRKAILHLFSPEK